MPIQSFLTLHWYQMCALWYGSEGLTPKFLIQLKERNMVCFYCTSTVSLYDTGLRGRAKLPGPASRDPMSDHLKIIKFSEQAKY